MNPIRKALPVLCDDVARLRAWFTVHRSPQPGTLRTNTDPTPPTLADGTAPFLAGDDVPAAKPPRVDFAWNAASSPAQHQQNDKNDPPSPITSFYSNLMAHHHYPIHPAPHDTTNHWRRMEPLIQQRSRSVMRACSHATTRITAMCCKAGRVLRGAIRGILGGISPRATPPPKRTVTTPKPLK